MKVYPAVFKQDGSHVMVTFPDVPEAMTQGDTAEEAYAAAQEVLGLALEDYKELPTPSTLASVREKTPGAVVALIPIDMLAYMRKYHSKTIRKSVTVPEYLAQMATERGINTSQLLTKALEKELADT